MALHPQFPTSAYAPLLPNQRWVPTAGALRSMAYEKLLQLLGPILVAKSGNVPLKRDQRNLGAAHRELI